MPRSRRSTLLLTVATLALPVALGACSVLETTPLESGIRSPSGGAMEPVADASKVDAGRLTRIAKATEAAGDVGNAAAMYQRAVALDPDSIDALLALANIYRRLGAPENAAHTYRAVISRQPDNLEARRGLGNALIALEKPEDALIEFERLIAADPLEPRGYNGRGVALSMAGRYEEARESFETGLKLAPDDVQLNNNLALSLAMSGRPTEAIPILKRLSSQPHASERVRENLALAERSAADSVRVSDLGPPKAPQPASSDVLYQAPRAAAQPEAENGAFKPAAATKSEKPIALVSEPSAETDVRQASSLIEELDRTTPAERAEPRDIPTDAAEPAAGGIDPDPASGLVVIETPALATRRAAPTPHPSATAPASGPATAADAAESATNDRPASTAVVEIGRATQGASSSIARTDEFKERRRDAQVAAPLPGIAPSAGGSTAIASNAATEPQRPAPADMADDHAGYRVQLSAERSSGEALARWQQLAETVPDLLGGLTPFVSATPNASGLYRLRTTVMPQAAAQNLCAALMARDIPCYLAAIRRSASSDAANSARIAPAAGDPAASRTQSSPTSEIEARPWHAL